MNSESGKALGNFMHSISRSMVGLKYEELEKHIIGKKIKTFIRSASLLL
jgi:hypothetical protein